MALTITIAVIIALVALRLLAPPVPGLAALSRRLGTREALVLCAIAVAAAVVLILVTKR